MLCNQVEQSAWSVYTTILLGCYIHTCYFERIISSGTGPQQTHGQASIGQTYVIRFAQLHCCTKDEINVPMGLSVFRDGDRSPRSGGGGMGPI